ncbi:hypothetical protein L6164_007235 [Bauhinia variegata]|uniref:Uncharacterized protein n=1 Tax=Bauhinia variegata TaxID=167791 RepID=A0ACB9PCG0_BAUVA|nr:hypothetical protein L6164_007235 [Bauhinia variegata]
MGIPQTNDKMEGWLYIIGSNRFGLHYSRKRYFTLKENCLRSFKAKPISQEEEPVRSALIDSYIRVSDNGRESIGRKVLFIFTVYNTSDQRDQLKLGASSPEEAGRWIHSLQDTALKECSNPAKNFMACSPGGWSSMRLGRAKRAERKNSVDWTLRSSLYHEATASDVIAPSTWKIFGCQNGLRLFKESKDKDSRGRHWDDHPAIMAVGVVDGTSEAVFHTLMSLNPSRSEWDFCIYRGSVVDHIDGHTDIIHMQLYNDWLPWGMKRRDMLLRRYWRREDDGTYVLLYDSVHNKKCPPQRGYVRACLKSGGFVVTPVNNGKQSLVKHMLAIDWKFWKLYLRPSAARTLTIRMLERVAAIRELFKAKEGNCSKSSVTEWTKYVDLPLSDKEDIKTEVSYESRAVGEPVTVENEVDKQRASLMGLNDSDEFFDVPEPMGYDQFDNEWHPDMTSDTQNGYHSKLSASSLVKKLHDLAVQKKGYVDLQEVAREETLSCSYGSTLQKDPSCTLPCSWAAADPSSFLIRGETYLQDNHKVKAKGTLMQIVGVDWLRSDRLEENLGSRPGGIVEKYASKGGPEFFFIVNIQVPGSTMYTLALYFMMKTPLEDHPLLKRFVDGDDAFRNSRLKLIPYISKGSWIVKQSVGKKACLIGQALETHYIRRNNYLEIQIDVGSSTVARGVVNLVLGYLNNLVIELAFVIQANTEEELPEALLGSCRLNHLDASKSVVVKP